MRVGVGLFGRTAPLTRLRTCTGAPRRSALMTSGSTVTASSRTLMSTSLLAAEETETIRFGTSVTRPFLRHPANRPLPYERSTRSQADEPFWAEQRRVRISGKSGHAYLQAYDLLPGSHRDRSGLLTYQPASAGGEYSLEVMDHYGLRGKKWSPSARPSAGETRRRPFPR